MAAKPITQIRVTNHNEQSLREMFDGDAFVFAKDEPAEIPLEAAVHIFGFMWSEKDNNYVIAINKDHVVARWGLNTPETFRTADAFIAAIELKPLRFKLQEVADDGLLPPPRDAEPEPVEVLEDPEPLPEKAPSKRLK